MLELTSVLTGAHGSYYHFGLGVAKSRQRRSHNNSFVYDYSSEEQTLGLCPSYNPKH